MERRLTEKGRYTEQSIPKLNRFRRFDWCRPSVILLSVLVSVISFDADALRFGVPETESFIGESLSVRIPLFDVVDPNSLIIGFESLLSEKTDQVKIELDQLNSTVAVKLTSEAVINEPYIHFKLKLTDTNKQFSRAFTVLLNLRDQEIPLVQGVQLKQLETNVVLANLAQSSTPNLRKGELDQGRILGPYDTAKTGQIPNKFGAVLEGQSLWRVARRINRAMGVSRSQMMWGLYRANPEAFLDNSVGSLKAGSYLTIPSEFFVKSVSHLEAKAKLTALVNEVQESISATAKVREAEDFDKEDFDVSDNSQNSARGFVETESSQASSFQVTGIDSSGEGTNISSEGQSQQIIVSLTETVSNLSKQLVLQDQKIEFLERQVVELKSFIDNDELTELTLSQVQLEQTPTLDNRSPASASSPDTKVIQETPSSGTEDGLNNDLASTIERTPFWQWVLLFFVIASTIVYFMRERLRDLGQSLNLFGTNDRAKFESMIAKQAEIDSRKQSKQNAAKKDYSTLSTADKNVTADDILNNVSYPDSTDDVPLETDEVWSFGPEEITEDAEDLSFNERFERLLTEKDFEFARELLDFARYNEINDERYHCERLHLFEKMKDEDGFYEYYYEIESQIPTFPQNLQTQISKLVVQLAQRTVV